MDKFRIKVENKIIYNKSTEVVPQKKKKKCLKGKG